MMTRTSLWRAMEQIRRRRSRLLRSAPSSSKATFGSGMPDEVPQARVCDLYLLLVQKSYAQRSIDVARSSEKSMFLGSTTRIRGSEGIFLLDEPPSKARAHYRTADIR